MKNFEQSNIVIYEGDLPAQKDLECYFANEYLQSYIDDDMSDENRKRIAKHLKNCPYCTYDYENMCEMRKKVRFELEKSNKSRKIMLAKIIECGITVAAVLFFVASLFFFFIKVHTFTKMDKSNLEISEYSFKKINF